MSETIPSLALEQINIVVRDMRKALAFYQLLGLPVEEVPFAESRRRPPPPPPHT